MRNNLRLSKHTIIFNNNHTTPLLTEANRIVIKSNTKHLSYRTSEKENAFYRENMEETFVKVKDDSLTLSVNVELEEQIVGDNIGQKFILKQALSEILKYENQRMPLPMPASLTVEQWRQLISLTDRKSRFYFLDSLLSGEMTFEEVQNYDDQLSKPMEVSEELINEVCEGDEEKRRKVSVFLWFHEERRQAGEEVPGTLERKNLIDITKANSKNGIRKYLDYMNDVEWNKLKSIRLKRYRQSNHAPGVKRKQEEIDNCSHIYYGLGHNTINLRLNDSTVDKHHNWSAWRQFILGQPLVVDFSYLSNLKSYKHIKSMIRQEAAHSVKFNREAKTPFALHFTGVSPEVQEIMNSHFCLDNAGNSFPVEITEKHQLDLFPPEKLVYLSPDSKNDLYEFNEDDVYVIGGIVDKGLDKAPLTLANAKKNKIRHARFPMKKVIGLKEDLNVETCVAIMNDMKYSQDWFYSLRWVPSRFFGNRVRKGSQLLEHKLTYRAHKMLSPCSNISEEYSESNKRLTPREYRKFYQMIMDANTREEVEQIVKALKV